MKKKILRKNFSIKGEKLPKAREVKDKKETVIQT